MTQDNPAARRARFEAYLNRHALVAGAPATQWAEEGEYLLVGTDNDRRRIDVASGRSEAWPGADPAAPGEHWTRRGYIAEIPVPEVLSPDGRWAAAIRDHDIELRATRDGRRRRVTSDGIADSAWDIESDRWRVLPGLMTGAVRISPWRPDSGALFACRRDISGVFRIPTVYWLGDFEEVEFTPFEKAGARIDRYWPHIVDIRSGLATPIEIGPVEDRYVQLLGWHPDGREVFVVAYDRDMSGAEIWAADAASGAARRLLRETSSTFLRLQHDTLMSGAHGFAFLPDGSGFLWLSARDGWTHVYRYDRDGSLIGQLTSGAWPVQDIEHVGRDGYVYLTAAVDPARPYDVHVCRVPLADGALERLTDAPGLHRPDFAPDGLSFLDSHSAMDRPAVTELRRADGTPVATVAATDIAALEAAGYRPPTEFTVKAADGETDLWGVMYLPADFDPAARYPVVEHIYGGPQIIAAARQFAIYDRRSRNLPWALAQLGYVVVCLDARGTPGRGKAFQDVVYGAWGVNEIADHAGAVRQLIDRHSWMDGDRVGIMGHSWGGYFATAALIQAPDLYRAAVASSPGFIPRESILYEPYLGLPANNPEAYARADLTRQAERLKGALLLVAGTSESAPISDSMKMTRALIDAGIDHEFVVLPGEFHAYSGATERYFIDKAVAFLDRHLRGAE